MKLYAKARLQASKLTAAPRQLLTSPVEEKLSDGGVRKFKDGHEWLAHVSDQGGFVLTVGQYAVTRYGGRAGVTKVYKTKWYDTEAPKPNSHLFKSFVADRRTEIAQALTAVRSTNHPDKHLIEKEAKTELDHYDQLLPAPDLPRNGDFARDLFKKRKIEGRRTQKWFHALTAEEQDEYCAKFPGTRFRHMRRLVAP